MYTYATSHTRTDFSIIYVCVFVCASVMEGQLKPSQTPTCLQISSLEATGRALLKMNAIVKATGKRTLPNY